MSKEPPAALEAGLRWPWVMLVVGLVWTALIRVPLVLNAEDHLDSDLAVDGLTLLDAMNGHWRWHYPGTPFLGILPMLASYPQALVWGPSAITLVGGGTIIWLAVVAATFWLARRAYGSAVAGWAIVPLVFSSIGTIWLSGRITGGHLLTLVWHTVAFVGLYACVVRGGWPRLLLLGFWCGLGLYLDAMFVFTPAGFLPAVLRGLFSVRNPRRLVGLAVVFLVGLGSGLVPRELGRLVDPHDAYPRQFQATYESPAVAAHARLLALRCLPRLIAGTELVELEERMFGRMGAGEAAKSPASGNAQKVLTPAREWPAVLLLAGLAAAIMRLALDRGGTAPAARLAVSQGIALSALLIGVAFLVNSNIVNSDNYRYLIYFLTAWSLGLGLLLQDLARVGRRGLWAAVVGAGCLAGAMTALAIRWYRDDCHYVNGAAFPVRIPQRPWRALAVGSPASAQDRTETARTYTIPLDATHVFGDYWDVYRIAFLSGGRITGVPFPMYPNRFRGWSRGLSPTEGTLLMLRSDGEAGTGAGQLAVGYAARARPEPISIGSETDWLAALAIVWKADGRERFELQYLHVIFP
jgi:hypothetical protein